MNNITAENQEDTELAILENIYTSSKRADIVRQRDLARIAGSSLGMTNAILKRLVQKGFIIVRKINSRNIQYIVTPDGVNEIARRSYRFFKRTIRNVVFYRDRIDESVSRAKARGLQAVLLVGMSDLDFIVEHACDRHGLPFLKAVDERVAATVLSGKVLAVYAENILKPEPRSNILPLVKTPSTSPENDGLFLSSILAGSEFAP
jgi:DNA-binding MarR family transcriptional regulator